ncbi:MAG: DegT/DnrJ/EryC1/StrS family aminotransferase [Candidatus Marinimicrobia bacterium]|nr:DegT/DnrJ/EryC1/StrS family aminotransferase [Candidatus Neomarinimicrobiota bacterium]
MKKKTYIGGELYWKPSLLFSKKKFNLQNYLTTKYPNKHYCLTGGGYYSIFKIIDEINFTPNDEILLPSYLCPTILLPFKKRNIKYKFFKVDKNLDIVIQVLQSKINLHTKAIFFINYFGFPPKDEAIKELKKYKNDGIIIIEDCVQSFFSDIEIIGNYAFNSFRKFLPVDGSVILSDEVVKCTKKKIRTTKYNIYKFIGQILRYFTVEHQIFDLSNLFLKMFSKANDDYYKHEYVGINYMNKLLLSKIDIRQLIDARKQNFKALAGHFKDFALFWDINNNIVPLGFPIILKNRDFLREKLMSKNIFCPIHWHLDTELNLSDNEEIIDLSKQILTIPLATPIEKELLVYLSSEIRRNCETIS